ncbi:MAG: serpin family protein [candidate division KSB1 bacterium]|nr:serpin family protein [candidate division KSB1 bacterium]
MSRKVTVVFGLGAMLLLPGCERKFSVPPEIGQPRALTVQEQALVQNSNQFGLRLFQQVLRSEDPNANVFVSPYSVAAALTMTANGAAGETQQAMWSTLGYAGLTPEEADAAFKALTELLLSLDPKVQLEITNAVWYRMGLRARETFVRLVRDYFGAVVSPLDFSSPSAPSAINNWASAKTHGKIRNVIDRIDPNHVMFLANAIYFKGLWTYRFDEGQTREEPFYVAEGRAIPCPMMVQTVDDLPYARSTNFAAVELPYGSGKFAMTVLLPDPGVSVDSLLLRLTPEALEDLFASFVKSKVTVWLPKFRLRYGRELSPDLKALGMEIAFDPNRADFRGLFEDPIQVFIDFVIHKSFVQVDEAGTEAAAVTVVGMMTTSVGPGERVILFRVDRPFAFLIHDRHSHTILFAGRIVEPRWEGD